MRPDRKTLLATTIMASLITGQAIADEAEAWRLFVSDHGDPVVNVIDGMSGEAIDRISVKGPATLHRTSSGETVFAVQGDAGVVSAISTGIAFEDHGDHGDIEIEDAKLLDLTFEGTKPAHFVEQQGNIALFFDGEETARLTTEKAVLEGKAKVTDAPVGAPHHGVAVPYRAHAVVTVPNPEDASQRPVGARIVDHGGLQVGDVHDCPGLHGSAGSGNLYALACHTGILVISANGSDAPGISHLAYPETLPEGNSSTLLGGKGLQYFLGNYGPQAVVLIDPQDEDAFRLIDLPTRRVHFAVDPVRAKFAYVFTEDGQLHQIDVLSGTIAKSLALTEPYSMDGHWSDPRPRIAVTGSEIAVTDPLGGVIHMVDAESFEPTRTIAVEGKPFNIVAVGGSGAVHDHD